jgi:hypothetical protein
MPQLFHEKMPPDEAEQDFLKLRRSRLIQNKTRSAKIGEICG